ncbi:MAG: hypothetical protein JXA13_02965 [Anaerolineales bacterium]|nr:hypothetical protein [Anaerolineales bacterium]
MQGKSHIPGAILTCSIYLLCILVFIARLLDQPRLEFWVGFLLLLTAFPLLFLLIISPRPPSPLLYTIQVGLMLLYLFIQLLLDFIFKFDFRSTQWLVIFYVTLFFATTGGILGIASLAGRKWMLASVSLFFAIAALAFIQRFLTRI